MKITHVEVLKVNLQDEVGSALLPILCLVGILSVFAMNGMTRSDADKLNRTQQKVRSGKAKLRRVMKKYAHIPASLRNSMNANTNAALKNCLTGQGACTTGSAQSFTLYSPLQGGDMIAGTQTKPVDYNWNAEACTPGSPCPFSVESQFTALCPGATLALPSGSCAQPDRILVSVILKIHSMAGSISMPLANSMDPVEVSVVDVMEIAQQLPPLSATVVTPSPVIVAGSFVPGTTTSALITPPLSVAAMRAPFDPALVSPDPSVPSIKSAF